MSDDPRRPSRSAGRRSRTIQFITLGCKANQYDTQSIRERFLSRGFREYAGVGKPGYYLINTCTVTSGADQKSRNLIRRCAQDNPAAAVIVTGCLAERDWGSLSGIKGVSLIVRKCFFPEGISTFGERTRAFLKIQDGCDNFCTYCKVALVRGRKRSKALGQVIAEAKTLVSHGYKEIVLTGICLGQYGRDIGLRAGLSGVIGPLEGIKGLLRIRLSSIEAGDLSPGLIGCLAKSTKFCRHLHVPIQSGDDGILMRMNRKYTRKKYRDLIFGIKKRIPGIAITTDCLVGFPGETENNFLNTLKLIRDIAPLKVHIFPYSARPGTKSAGYTNEVDPVTMKSRCARLESVAAECRRNFLKGFTGKSLPVLVEGAAKGMPGYLEGFTDNYIKVYLPFKPGLRGNIAQACMKGICAEGLRAEYVDNSRFGVIV
jgi:threonylcarbamoyladenosine tRNA methylthiotransferase MtaB